MLGLTVRAADRPVRQAQSRPPVVSSQKPNIVVIYIDDLGYGDIGPFGSKINKTPHLDRMAEEGMKLSSFYAAAPVCTPSRAALMTGCYPKRVDLAFGSWAGVLFPKDRKGLNPSEITMAEILKEQGYATGCFGKWHLGDQPEFLPNKHGFDEYYGIPYSNDMWSHHGPSKTWKSGVCPLPLLRNGKVEQIVKDMKDQAELGRQLTEEAISFIRKNKDKRFFVYLPHAFVHYPRQGRKEYYEDGNIPGNNYGNRPNTKAVIEEIDWSTGQILDVLRELKLEKNTLVVFTSDNGGARGCVNKPLRGGKGSTWEGGLRVCTLAWWPGSIPKGSTSDEVMTVMDLLPTFASLAGGKVPGDRVIDGKDISPLLLGKEGAKSPHEAFYYFSQNHLKAVRCGDWKLHKQGKKTLLHNLREDIGESKNVAKENPEVVARLEKKMADFNAEMNDPTKVRKAAWVEKAEFLVEVK